MPRGIYNRKKTFDAFANHPKEDDSDITNDLEQGQHSIKNHEGKKYLRTIRSITGQSEIEVDVYEVLEAFKVTCPAVQHAVKKLLAPGQRGKGSILQDLIGAKAAIDRAIELQQRRDGDNDGKS